MNDNTTNHDAETNNIDGGTGEGAEIAASAAAPVLTIPTAFYAGATLGQSQDAVTFALEQAEAQGVPVAQNFKEEDELPEGYGIAVRAISKRGKGLQGVIIAMQPTLEAILSHDKGDEYMRSTICADLMDKLANAVRGVGDSVLFGGIMRFSLGDFLAPAKLGEGLQAFRAIASVFVDALKKKGAKKMTSGLLRQICESAAFAEAEFPHLPQEQWQNVINTMSSKASAAGEDTAIFAHWLATRDQVEIVSDDLDLDDLSGLLG